MFHEVRVLDCKGNTKKVLPSKLLSKRYWNSFFKSATKAEVSKKYKAKVKEENKYDKKIKDSYENHDLTQD